MGAPVEKTSVERSSSPPTLRWMLLAFEYPKVMFISFGSPKVWSFEVPFEALQAIFLSSVGIVLLRTPLGKERGKGLTCSLEFGAIFFS